jgi:predicted amidohydrolase YtcJ
MLAPLSRRPHNHGLLTVPPETLAELMTRATGGGLACAVHAIGDVANSHALDAFATTGATGTIEHAQLVAHVDIPASRASASVPACSRSTRSMTAT